MFKSVIAMLLLSMAALPVRSAEVVQSPQLAGLHKQFKDQLTELNRAIDARERELRYSPGQLGIRFRSTLGRFLDAKNPEQLRKDIGQYAAYVRKNLYDGVGIEDTVEVRPVNAKLGASKALDFSNGGDSLDPRNTLDRAFIQAIQALEGELNRAKSLNPKLALFTVVSWDAYVTVNELAVADTATGEVLFIGLAHL